MGLGEKALHKVGFGLALREQHLHGQVAIEPLVARPIHRSHAAAGNLFQDFVAGELRRSGVGRNEGRVRRHRNGLLRIAERSLGRLGFGRNWARCLRIGHRHSPRCASESTDSPSSCYRDGWRQSRICPRHASLAALGAQTYNSGPPRQHSSRRTVSWPNRGQPPTIFSSICWSGSLSTSCRACRWRPGGRSRADWPGWPTEWIAAIARWRLTTFDKPFREAIAKGSWRRSFAAYTGILLRLQSRCSICRENSTPITGGTTFNYRKGLRW